MKFISTINFVLLAYFVGLMAFMLDSCTYSINMIHSQGEANDMIDENQKANADIKPNLNLHPLR